MQEALQKLTNLQYIDSRIDEIRRLRGDLPEEILDIETDIHRTRAKVEKLREESDQLVGEKKRLELEIDSATEKIKKYEDQQLSVRNNREYDALTKEIEAQKKFTENATQRIIAIEERLEAIGPETEEKEVALEKIEKIYEEKQVELESVTKSTREEEENLLDIRETIEKELDERYLRSYNRLRNGLNNGIAVVAMEKGAALGMSLPPQVQVEVARRNKIIIDENSGRIVVDPSFFKQAKKELGV
jgi:predicted  nucleic acid-binding Zn-ribbon protein